MRRNTGKLASASRDSAIPGSGTTFFKSITHYALQTYSMKTTLILDLTLCIIFARLIAVMGKIKKIVLCSVLFCGFISVHAQESETLKVQASTIIQQKYVKFPWQESGGVFLLIVDALAPDVYSPKYSRKAYFRYLDQSTYISSLHEILPDTCIEDLNLNLDNIQQTVAKINAIPESNPEKINSECTEIVYDAQQYQGFFHSLKEDQFNFEALKSYNPYHAYQLTNEAFNFIQQNLNIANRVSYKKIKDRYLSVRACMLGRPFNQTIKRNIMSGLTPLLEKISNFSDYKNNNSPHQRWINLKNRSEQLIERVGYAYGNNGEY
ncbi:hypothetical protein MRY82_05000 [bacterium]|nr:hypothetical protein [bacterium]